MKLFTPPPTDRRIAGTGWMINGVTVDDLLSGEVPACIVGARTAVITPAAIIAARWDERGESPLLWLDVRQETDGEIFRFLVGGDFIWPVILGATVTVIAGTQHVDNDVIANAARGVFDATWLRP